MDAVESLHTEILGCTRCQAAGCIPRAAPVVSGRIGQRILLIGQAPGITELEIRRPFAGRAGKELFRWMQRIDISELDFRQHVYMTAVTKCFPGKALSGGGDRRPSRTEIALCAPYLERQLALMRPEVVLLVGGLAIDRYFLGIPLTALIGRRFEVGDARCIPLPHPSGASRWLNDSANRDLLQSALELVREEWERVVLAPVAGG